MSHVTTCIYCFKRNATTADEIPGRGFFHDLGKKMRTYNCQRIRSVPACEKCNNRLSRYNRHFRDLMAMAGNSHSAEAKKYLEPLGKTWTYWNSHPNVRKSLLARTEAKWVTSQAGLVVGKIYPLTLNQRDNAAIRIKLTKYVLATYALDLGELKKSDRSYQWTALTRKQIEELFNNKTLKNEHPDIYAYSAKRTADGAEYNFIFFNSVGFNVRMWNKLEGYKDAT